MSKIKQDIIMGSFAEALSARSPFPNPGTAHKVKLHDIVRHLNDYVFLSVRFYRDNNHSDTPTELGLAHTPAITQGTAIQPCSPETGGRQPIYSIQTFLRTNSSTVSENKVWCFKNECRVATTATRGHLGMEPSFHHKSRVVSQHVMRNEVREIFAYVEAVGGHMGREVLLVGLGLEKVFEMMLDEFPDVVGFFHSYFDLADTVRMTGLQFVPQVLLAQGHDAYESGTEYFSMYRDSGNEAIRYLAILHNALRLSPYYRAESVPRDPFSLERYLERLQMNIWLDHEPSGNRNPHNTGKAQKDSRVVMEINAPLSNREVEKTVRGASKDTSQKASRGNKNLALRRREHRKSQVCADEADSNLSFPDDENDSDYYPTASARKRSQRLRARGRSLKKGRRGRVGRG